MCFFWSYFHIIRKWKNKEIRLWRHQQCHLFMLKRCNSSPILLILYSATVVSYLHGSHLSIHPRRTITILHGRVEPYLPAHSYFVSFVVTHHGVIIWEYILSQSIWARMLSVYLQDITCVLVSLRMGAWVSGWPDAIVAITE